MAIKMQNYGLTWTDADGRNHASVVSYDKGSADDYKSRLEADGCTRVEITATRPGQLLEPKA